MIAPYSGPIVVHLGPLSFPIFGALVASGVVVGHAVVLRLAREKGVPEEEMRTAAIWALVAGFVFSHLFDVVLYHPDRIAREGVMALLRVWQGISSYGGFFGGLMGVAFYFRRLGKPWWVHADMLIQGLVVGWVFGRLGCTLTSDHMGSLSNFPLAFSYASGARHNLGFYELVYTVTVLLPAILLVRRREGSAGYRPGIYVAVVVALYAPARFALDFLRASDIEMADPRYLGLTAAQYSSMAVFAVAVVMLRRVGAIAGDRTRTSR